MRRRTLTQIFIALIGMAAPLLADAQLVIVTSEAGPIKTLTRSEAERLYLGRTTTLSDNTSVTLIDLPPGPERDRFYFELTGKNPVQTRANWSRQVFTGRALPPRQAGSVEDLRVLLNSDPYSIGYMPSSQIPQDLRRLIEVSR